MLVKCFLHFITHMMDGLTSDVGLSLDLSQSQHRFVVINGNTTLSLIPRRDNFLTEGKRVGVILNL